MYAVFTFRNQILNLFNSALACIALVLSASGTKTHVVYGKHNSVEQRLILGIERAVDEDVSVIIRREARRFGHLAGPREEVASAILAFAS